MVCLALSSSRDFDKAVEFLIKNGYSESISKKDNEKLTVTLEAEENYLSFLLQKADLNSRPVLTQVLEQYSEYDEGGLICRV
jgi:hypothetical protein